MARSAANCRLKVLTLLIARQASRTAVRFTWYGTDSHSGFSSLQLRHHHAGDVSPRCRYARLQNLNHQVVDPSTRVQPGCYPGLLLLHSDRPLSCAIAAR